MNRTAIINITISATLILSIGIITGYTAGYFHAKTMSFPEIKIVEDINEGIATIKLMQVKNGQLIGKIDGRTARLAYNSDNIMELNAGDEFTIPISQINLKDYYIADSLPTGTQFIASKSGKYYYSILDKKAFNIVEKNRIYFKNEEDAKEKGYQPSK
ncbi:hypothetical protein JW758_00095 [Candidatus Peregrinibacteria bacterium]|nr:hypothetical protein [Candidatus Peregrinibacteria bacterium]